MFPLFCKSGPVLISCITDAGEIQLADATIELYENGDTPENQFVRMTGGQLKMYFHITRDPHEKAARGESGKPVLSLPHLESTLLAFASTIQQLHGNALWPRKAVLTPMGHRDLHDEYEVV